MKVNFLYFRRCNRRLENRPNAFRRTAHYASVRDNSICTKQNVPDRAEPRPNRLLRAEFILRCWLQIRRFEAGRLAGANSKWCCAQIDQTSFRCCWLLDDRYSSFFDSRFDVILDPITRNSETMDKCVRLAEGSSFDNDIAIMSSYGNWILKNSYCHD